MVNHRADAAKPLRGWESLRSGLGSLSAMGSPSRGRGLMQRLLTGRVRVKA